MGESIGHVRGAIVNPKTGQPTKLFYDILARLSSDTESVIREQFPWNVSLSSSQLINEAQAVFSQPPVVESGTVLTTVVESGTVLTTVVPQRFEWHEVDIASNHTISFDESVRVVASDVTVTFPSNGGQDSRFRVVKGTNFVRFDANGSYLYIGSDAYTCGSLPGGAGSVLEFEYSTVADGWMIV